MGDPTNARFKTWLTIFFFNLGLNWAGLVIREGVGEQRIKALGFCDQILREKEETVLFRGGVEWIS